MACPSKGRRRSNLQRVPQNFQNPTVYKNGIKENCVKPLILQHGRYVLRYWRPARPWKKECTPKTTRVGPCRDTCKGSTQFFRFAFQNILAAMNFPSQAVGDRTATGDILGVPVQTTMGTAPLPSTSKVSQCAGPEMNCGPM